MCSITLDYNKKQSVALDDCKNNKIGLEIQPMDWSSIQKFHLNPPTISLPRQKCVLQEYETNMKKIKQETTIVDYLFKKYLSGTQQLVLVPNEYPYYCQDGIIHYLLWVHPSFKVYNNEQIKCIISFRLYDLKIKYQNFIFFENNLNNKSIPEIKHYHVFILLK